MHEELATTKKYIHNKRKIAPLPRSTTTHQVWVQTKILPPTPRNYSEQEILIIARKPKYRKL
jgi:hypothetical protein